MRRGLGEEPGPLWQFLFSGRARWLGASRRPHRGGDRSTGLPAPARESRSRIRLLRRYEHALKLARVRCRHVFLKSPLKRRACERHLMVTHRALFRHHCLDRSHDGNFTMRPHLKTQPTGTASVRFDPHGRLPCSLPATILPFGSRRTTNGHRAHG